MIKSLSNTFARRSLDKKHHIHQFRLTGRIADHCRTIWALFAGNLDLSDNGSLILSMRVFRIPWMTPAVYAPTYKVEREKQRVTATNMTTVARLENPRRLEISRSCYPICLFENGHEHKGHDGRREEYDMYS